MPGTGYRFFSPAELAVAQGFPAGITLPSDNRAAWQLLGNAIPPPMALLGLLGPVALLTGSDAQGRQAAVDWARGAFGRLLGLAQGNWGGQRLSRWGLTPWTLGTGPSPPHSCSRHRRLLANRG